MAGKDRRTGVRWRRTCVCLFCSCCGDVNLFTVTLYKHLYYKSWDFKVKLRFKVSAGALSQTCGAFESLQNMNVSPCSVLWSDGKMTVCVCVCVVSVSGEVSTAAPVGHLSSQSYQQGSCNLAANLIIQIAEYLMVLKRRVKNGRKKKKLYYLLTPYCVTSIQATPGGPVNILYLTHVLNYWLIIYHNSCHSKLNNALQDLGARLPACDPGVDCGLSRWREGQCSMKRRGTTKSCTWRTKSRTERVDKATQSISIIIMLSINLHGI